MLKQLMSLIQDNSQEAIVNNPAIPNQHNTDVMQTIAHSVMQDLRDETLRNDSIVFTLGPDKIEVHSNKNPLLAGSITQNATRSLVNKFGLLDLKAGDIVSQVIPSVLSLTPEKMDISKNNHKGLVLLDPHSICVEGLPNEHDTANIQFVPGVPDSSYSFSEVTYQGQITVTEWR